MQRSRSKRSKASKVKPALGDVLSDIADADSTRSLQPTTTHFHSHSQKPKHDKDMTSAVVSVLIASVSSVAKVFLIAIVGLFAVKHPRNNPLIPPASINVLSRFAFTVLNIPLVYSSIGSTLSIDVIGSLWFVPLAGMVVIALSFVIATMTERLPFFRVEHRVDFDALRIACSFPNVVAIPVLVFPSLCEYEIVWKVFVPKDGDQDELTRNPITECSNTMNAMTFSYFFAWLFMFFLLGNQALISAGKRKRQEEEADRLGAQNCADGSVAGNGSSPPINDPRFDIDSDEPADFSNEPPDGSTDEHTKHVTLENTAENTKNAAKTVLVALKRSILNPGSIALWAGLITALIAPLQAALFSPGGALRFAGSAIESLAAALPSVATIITAASLIVPPDPIVVNHTSGDPTDEDKDNNKKRKLPLFWPLSWLKQDGGENAVYDPNYADGNVQREEEWASQQQRRKSSLARMRRASIRLGSQSLVVMRSPTFKMHLWFNVTRLIITPAIVCGIVIGLDCGTSLFDTVPHLSKLVVLMNSSIPPAMLVVLSLKSEGMTESASVVSKLFTSSYLLSVFTIAGWASVGLMLSIPDDDGKYFCETRL